MSPKPNPKKKPSLSSPLSPAPKPKPKALASRQTTPAPAPPPSPSPAPKVAPKAKEESEAIDRQEAGSRLRCARESAGVSFDDACSRLGISKSRLSQIEYGRKVFSWPRLIHWTVTLGLDPALVVPEFFTAMPKKKE